MFKLEGRKICCTTCAGSSEILRWLNPFFGSKHGPKMGSRIGSHFSFLLLGLCFGSLLGSRFRRKSGVSHRRILLLPAEVLQADLRCTSVWAWVLIHAFSLSASHFVSCTYSTAFQFSNWHSLADISQMEQAALHRMTESIAQLTLCQVASEELRLPPNFWKKLARSSQGFSPSGSSQPATKSMKHRKLCCPVPRFAAATASSLTILRLLAAGAEPADQRRDEKLHAVVARSTFPSQNVQNTPFSDHFWKLRCRKSARRCGAKHISKSKCTKHTSSGPLFVSWDVKKVHAVVARSIFGSQNVQSTPCTDHFWKLRCRKKCTPLWREAHLEVKMYKTHHVRTTFGGSDVEKVHAVVARSTFRSQNVKSTRGSDHFWRFRCRFASLRFTTLHYITLHYISTTLHYTTLHYTTFHYTPLH